MCQRWVPDAMNFHSTAAVRCLTAWALAACSFASVADTTVEDAAANLVKRQHMGGNLGPLAVAMAVRTPTFATLATKLGAAEAKAEVKREVSVLVYRYQPRWNQNLASAYAKHFNAEELASLAEAGRQSPYARTSSNKLAAMAVDMRNESEPVLAELVTETLLNVAKRAGR
jgi:hypothetical protein